MNRYRAGGESSRHEYAAHTQNNTICELVAVVVVGAGESVEKPANPCQCWIFLALSDLVSCRRAGGFSVESCKRSPQGVSRRCHGVVFSEFCSFSVETVERTRCDILVENFAEIGKIKTEFLENSDFSQPVGKVLHNSDFSDAIRIFLIFRNFSTGFSTARYRNFTCRSNVVENYVVKWSLSLANCGKGCGMGLIGH